MSHGKAVPINLQILEKDYVVACPEEERDTLMAAEQYFNDKIKEIREDGKVVSTERMVVISALNIIHEYLHYKQQKEHEALMRHNERVRLQDKIDFVLSEFKK